MAAPGVTEAKDRVLAALIYILPLIYGLPFGIPLLKDFPILSTLYVPLSPLISLYYGFPLMGIIIFFVLLFAVVRNERVSHFIRFNAMQVILLNILLFIGNLIFAILEQGFSPNSLLVLTLLNTVFLGTVAASIYGMVQSARGVYAELPGIAEAAYSQVR
ncbi:MAG: hypothetical protein IGR93_20220 [Hydrococcus sp. C42_A2020_068]|uniref:Tic20 family protein n=1 Tax=Pleurocapsa sp. PCC 7327 TaxID=118163 RepID=UPI00029F9CBE|nr:Tic20 family protein [Pleurocapsa sp. PCC 7327]AFY78451.1 integral membrane protein (PIN domain superfamily) [Pleurocapsa sp. PCC 7327]MBF2022350.1 hypothetical protein [Hydrococcus sp. C42_A2020_068]